MGLILAGIYTFIFATITVIIYTTTVAFRSTTAIKIGVMYLRVSFLVSLANISLASHE